MRCINVGCSLNAIDHRQCAVHGRGQQTVAREKWFCDCPTSDVDSIGECRACHRKPRELMKVGAR